MVRQVCAWCPSGLEERGWLRWNCSGHIKVEAWAWKEENKKKGGQLWRRLTPGLPSSPKAREDRIAPWEELGLRAPQALPKLAGLAEGQEVRVKAQQREGEELQIL